MDESYSPLVSEIWDLSQSKRVLVGIAGPPGSGKSTIVQHLAAILDQRACKTGLPPVAIVPLDGFHYSRSQLDSFSNAKEAYKRRGAPWTFDVKAALNLVRELHASALVVPGERQQILAPSFDHAIKDPVENDITIPADADVVILEGNYILLDEEGWRDMGPLLDLRVMVTVEPDEARTRVARRHVLSGIEDSIELAEARFDSNDAINGDLVRARSGPYDVVVASASGVLTSAA